LKPQKCDVSKCYHVERP